MAPRIDHNNTVPLIKMTLSRTAKHIPRAPVQNSQAVVRKGGFILYHGRAGILYTNVILLLSQQPVCISLTFLSLVAIY